MQTVALQNQAAAEATVFAVRQDEAADEPTHSRVIEHTEQLVGAALVLRRGWARDWHAYAGCTIWC